MRKPLPAPNADAGEGSGELNGFGFGIFMEKTYRPFYSTVMPGDLSQMWTRDFLAC